MLDLVPLDTSAGGTGSVGHGGDSGDDGINESGCFGEITAHEPPMMAVPETAMV